ncbi:MarR family winged helix-turn-helix transcriptional regulator [Arthrobacter roseus]
MEVLNALRDYRTAETAMRAHASTMMGMGKTDLAAVRCLLQARQDGRDLSPKELSAKLDISSASTTVLIDRLVKSGHARREPHPTDGRALLIQPTESSDSEVRSTLTGMHSRMIEAAQSLTEPEADAVITFLQRMRSAVVEP